MEVVRVHPSTFEEAMQTALNAEHNFKLARLGWNGYNPSSARAYSTSAPTVNRPEPMDLSYAEDEGEVELQAAESNVLYDGVTRAEALNTYVLVSLCVDSARLRVNTLPRARSLAWHGEMPTPSRRGAPYWGRIRFCNTFRR